MNEKVLNPMVKSTFAELAEPVLADPLLFGDFLTANPNGDDVGLAPQLYEDCGDY